MKAHRLAMHQLQLGTPVGKHSGRYEDTKTALAAMEGSCATLFGSASGSTSEVNLSPYTADLNMSAPSHLQFSFVDLNASQPLPFKVVLG